MAMGWNAAQSEVNFEFSQIVGTGLRSTDIATGDINNDGRIDLVVSNMFDHSVTIIINDGNGNFDETMDEPLGEGPEGERWNHALSPMVGDLDGDEFADMVVCNFQLLENAASPFQDGGVIFMYGSADGTFEKTRMTIEGIPSTVEIHDFTGDGLNDVIVGNLGTQVFEADQIGQFDGGLAPFENAGDREFEKLPQIFDDFNIGSIAQFILIDADGDGIQDIVGIDQGTLRLQNFEPVLVEPKFTFFAGNGSTFEFQLPKTLNTQFEGWSLDKADFNNDGQMDIVMAFIGERDDIINITGENASLEFFLNDSGQFSLEPDLSLPVEEAAAFFVISEDYDLDGDIDIALTAQNFINRPEGTELVPFLRIYDNDGNNNFTLVQELDLAENPRVMTSGQVWIYNNQAITGISDWNLY